MDTPDAEVPKDLPPPPSSIQQIDVPTFLARAHNFKGLDEWIEAVQKASGADDRAMLRVCIHMLHTLLHGVDHNDGPSGLDGPRFDMRTGVVTPSWRECIAGILGVRLERTAPPEAEPMPPSEGGC